MEIFIDRETINDIEIDSKIRSVKFNIQCLNEIREKHKGQEVIQFVIGDKLQLVNEELRVLELVRYGVMVRKN